MIECSHGSARIEFDVKFSRGRKGSRRMKAPSKAAPKPTLRSVPPQVPKITRFLVLGHYFERLVQSGKVKNYAEIARLTGLSRARVTQIVNLTLLPPEIQGSLLIDQAARDGHVPHESGLRKILRSRLLGARNGVKRKRT